MGYNKVIKYRDTIEIYEYKENIRNMGRKPLSTSCKVQSVGTVRSNSTQSSQQEVISFQKRRGDNAKRSAMVFRRLVSANLGQLQNPLFISFTYSEHITDFRQGYKDFKAFVSNARDKFGEEFSYIAVPELTKRKRIHFHSLIFASDTKILAETERNTRLFARLWGKGFVDVILTDGSDKLASYMAKYMTKTFINLKAKNVRAFSCSRNWKRPIVEKNALIEPYFCGDIENLPNLSTESPSRDKEYMTQWLGRGRYRLFENITIN